MPLILYNERTGAVQVGITLYIVYGKSDKTGVPLKKQIAGGQLRTRRVNANNFSRRLAYAKYADRRSATYDFILHLIRYLVFNYVNLNEKNKL